MTQEVINDRKLKFKLSEFKKFERGINNQRSYTKKVESKLTDKKCLIFFENTDSDFINDTFSDRKLQSNLELVQAENNTNFKKLKIVCFKKNQNDITGLKKHMRIQKTCNHNFDQK